MIIMPARCSKVEGVCGSRKVAVYEKLSDMSQLQKDPTLFVFCIRIQL
jgi:hypothetical protein